MYKQRIKIFLAVIGLVLAGLVAKLIQLQVVQADDYRRQFERNLITTELLPTIRGRILDRTGKILAEDKQCYEFCLDYRFIVQDARWVKRRIAAIRKSEGRSASEAERVYQERVDNTWSLARKLCEAHHVDLQERLKRICRRVQQIRDEVGGPVAEEKIGHPIVQVDETSGGAAATIGASFEPSLQRWYPLGDLACHVIGRTAEVTLEKQNLLNFSPQQADKLARIFNNYLDGDDIGDSGVEKMCEQQLRGRRGVCSFRRGGEIVDMTPAERGQDVTLSIDAEMQDFLARIFFRRGAQGAAVVISVPTGEVLAMVSVPTYDLNTFLENYKTLLDNDVDLPQMNRAVGGRYHPGSTAKVVTSFAGMDAGLSSGTRFVCHGALDPGDPNTLHCHYLAGHQSLDLVEAIKASCNVYFYNVGRRAGALKMAEWFDEFGFGKPTGIGLPEEVGGHIPKVAMNRGDPMQWAIGQGQVTATPLQVANEMATVARNGEYFSPVLIKGAEPAVRRRLPVTAEQMAAVRKGLWKVVNESGGTGYSVFRAEILAGEKPPVTSGKTGTADTEPLRRDINGDGRVEPDEIVRQGNMAWFAGYSTENDPQVAFAILVEFVPGHGGTEAGPIARELVTYCQAKGYLGK